MWWLEPRGIVRPGCANGFGSMDLTTGIETRPSVRSGKPCFVGTRIAVFDVQEYLAAGMSPEKIVADFRELIPELVGTATELAALSERR